MLNNKELFRKHNPDKADILFRSNQGEFSIDSDIAFQKHLQKYSYLKDLYINENGQFIDKLTNQEPLWLGSQGINHNLGKRLGTKRNT